jgi:hypothetical protein
MDADSANAIVWFLIVITGVLQLPLLIDALDNLIPGGLGRSTQVCLSPLKVQSVVILGPGVTRVLSRRAVYLLSGVIMISAPFSFHRSTCPIC